MLSVETRQMADPTRPATTAGTTSRRGAAASGLLGQIRHGHIDHPGSP